MNFLERKSSIGSGDGLVTTSATVLNSCVVFAFVLYQAFKLNQYRRIVNLPPRNKLQIEIKIHILSSQKTQ